MQRRVQKFVRTGHLKTTAHLRTEGTIKPTSDLKATVKAIADARAYWPHESNCTGENRTFVRGDVKTTDKIWTEKNHNIVHLRNISVVCMAV